MEYANPMRSLSRAIDILECFSINELELSGSDIARKVGIPKSTAYRILESLNRRRLLQQNTETGKFSIGPFVYSMGSLYLSSADILKSAEPVIRTLNELTDEALNLIIRDKQNVLVLMKEESRSSVRYSHHIGSSWPAYASAVGKALLSELSDAEINSLFPEEKLQQVTNKTIDSKTKLKLELEQIRKTGISYNKGGLFEGGEGIGSIIRDAKGVAIAGLSITMPVFRIEQFGRNRLAELIRMGAILISYRLGYQGEAKPVHDVQEIRSWWEQSQ